MSKIIEALERAKQDGTLDQFVTPVSERDTVAPRPVEMPGARSPAPARHTSDMPREAGGALDPTLLEGVDWHLMALHKPMSVIAEQYRSLRNRIERLNRQGKVKLVGITSSVKGEGKSVTAGNLSVVMAQALSRRVALVDADLRRPKVHELLQLDRSPGLAGYLQGEAPFEEAMQVTPYYGLEVLPAGAASEHPSELLAGPKMVELLARLREEYDYVIFDTPPLHPISDVNFLVESLDGVVLVVRANRTSRGLVQQAATSLPEGKVLGTLLNRAASMRQGYGYGYGYGKGGYYSKYY